jgi:hypothetical protein
MEAEQNFKPLILKGENGGRSRDRTVDLLLVSSTFTSYIADSYSGHPPSVRPPRVSTALNAQHFEQLIALTVSRPLRDQQLHAARFRPHLFGNRGISIPPVW